MAGNLKEIVFHNGSKMPIVGLGTWQASDKEVDDAVDAALEAGYRHFDTAFVYLNEAAIGKALARWFASGRIKREDVFIVTKLPMCGLQADRVEKYINLSLAALQLTYVDLYLVHFPAGLQEVEGNLFPTDKDGNMIIDVTTDHVSLWKAMEAQVDAGKTRSIGLSNFNARQIERIVGIARIPPANLQIELHVYLQQLPLRAVCDRLGVTICAYGPLGSPGLPTFLTAMGGDASKIPALSPLTDPTVTRLAEKHGKTPAQVLLRHIVQQGIAVIPKSANPTRIAQNIDVFDFVLSDADMKELNALDKGADGRLFGRGMLKGMEAHPEDPLADPF